MMHLCEWIKGSQGETCPHWAQWKAIYPDNIIRRFCSTHKEQHQKDEAREDVKYVFMGAEPSGIDNPKS